MRGSTGRALPWSGGALHMDVSSVDMSLSVLIAPALGSTNPFLHTLRYSESFLCSSCVAPCGRTETVACALARRPVSRDLPASGDCLIGLITLYVQAGYCETSIGMPIARREAQVGSRAPQNICQALSPDT